MSNRRPLFSSYFLRFLRAITIWREPSLWRYAVDFLFHYVECPSLSLYFSNYPKTLKKNRKSRLKYPKELYLLLFQTSYYLLKMDITMTLEIFTKINLKNSHLSLGDFEDVSRKLENVHFSENISKTVIKNPKTFMEKIIFVLKMTIPFCQLDRKDSLFKLTYLNSECNEKIRSRIIKRILMKDNLDKRHRKSLWILISEISVLGNQ
jgi:hypothetical protein